MTQKLNQDQDDDNLAAEYALGLLPRSERSDFEVRLGKDKNLADKLLFWEEKFSPLSDALEPVPAPNRVLKNIEARLFAEKTSKPNWLQSLAFWRGLSFASLAAAFVALGLFVQQPTFIQQPTQNAVAEVVAPDSALKLVVLYDSEKNHFKLNRVAGAPAQGRDFELWLVVGKNAPISLGVLPIAERGEIMIPAAYKDKLAGAVLAISDEPLGGSPTGKATGPVVAVGTINFI